MYANNRTTLQVTLGRSDKARHNGRRFKTAPVMTPDHLLSALLFIVALYGSPGPVPLTLIASGAAFGLRASLPFIAGTLFGVCLLFIASAFGLSLLFEQYPETHRLFQYLCLGYIGYLAWRLATAGTRRTGQGKALGFGSGVLLNLLNPKGYIATLGTIAQFSLPGPDYGFSIAVLLGMILVSLWFIDCGWCYGGARLARLLADERKAPILNCTLASVLLISVCWATFGTAY